MTNHEFMNRHALNGTACLRSSPSERNWKPGHHLGWINHPCCDVWHVWNPLQTSQSWDGTGGETFQNSIRWETCQTELDTMPKL